MRLDKLDAQDRIELQEKARSAYVDLATSLLGREKAANENTVSSVNEEALEKIFSQISMLVERQERLDKQINDGFLHSIEKVLDSLSFLITHRVLPIALFNGFLLGAAVVILAFEYLMK